MFTQVYQSAYRGNYVFALIASVYLFFVLTILIKFVHNTLDKEKKLEKSAFNKYTLISGLIILGIILGLSELLEFLGYFGMIFRILNNGYLYFAIMMTIFYPIFMKIQPSRSNHIVSSQFLNRIKKLILISWIVAFLFLTINIFGIQIEEVDVFFLGFIWAFGSVFILSLLLYIFNSILSPERRVPRDILKKSIVLSGLIAFGIWSIQLFIIELYLKRLIGIILYSQDIRILIIVISGLFISSFILLLKYKFIPEIQAETRAKVLTRSKSENIDEKIYENGNILSVKNLVTRFYTEEGIVNAIDGVSFDLRYGEVLGLVGETGCGKSVTALSIIQLIQSPGVIENGHVIFMGEDLLSKSIEDMRKYRGKDITMIFQDPLNSLNPVYKVGTQISEVFLLHMQEELLKEAFENENSSIYSIARDWSIELLRNLKIPNPESIFDRYPHELSGGMRQRVQIAMGLACNPKLLIADEPTTALDVTVQRQILRLMKDLQAKYNTSILYITHDLGIVSKLCDKVAVMYSGHIVEYGNRLDIFKMPYHPYTKGLMSSIPMTGERKKELNVIQGTVPNLIYPPSGCRFHPRCPKQFEPCKHIRPKTIEIEKGRYVECHLYDKEFS